MTNEGVAEVIAHLDTIERDVMGIALKLREYRHMLFETLDNEVDDVLD